MAIYLHNGGLLSSIPRRYRARHLLLCKLIHGHGLLSRQDASPKPEGRAVKIDIYPFTQIQSLQENEDADDQWCTLFD